MRRWTGIPHRFLAALQFLTVVPPIVRRPFMADELGAAVGYFPLVGALLGATLAIAATGLSLIFPWTVAAALVLAAWVAFTGALHLDGLLDTCDGLLGGATPDDRLRILRDESVGAFALAGGVVTLLLKYVSLAALPNPVAALVLAPTLGRWAMALEIVSFPYAHAEGLGRAMNDHAGWRAFALATAFAFGTAWLAGGLVGLVAGALVAGLAWTIARFALARIPGLTGDVYGATCELAEVVVLLTMIAQATLRL